MRTLKSLLAVSLVTVLLAACTNVITQPTAAPTGSGGKPSTTAEPTARPSAQSTEVVKTAGPETVAPETAEPETPAPETASPTPSATEGVPPTQTPEITAPPPTPTETSGSSTQTNGLIVDWSAAADPGFGRVYDFIATATSNGTYVAIGEYGESLASAVWVSSDGLQWHMADFPDGTNSLVRLSAVTSGGPGFVVVGSEYAIDTDIDSGVAWISSDGQSWQRVDAPAFISHPLDLVGSATGTVVAFSSEGGAFTSSDGDSWVASSDPGALAIAAGLLTIGGDGSTLWAFSRDQDETRETQQKIAAWQTSDGASWTQVGTIDGSAGASEAHAAGGPDGMVVIANKYIHQTSAWNAWFSADGATWQPALQNPTNITDVLADEAGFVAVGHYNSVPGCALSEENDVGVTWTSVDGVRWRQMPEKGWKAREVQVVTRVDRTLIGLGVDYKVYNDHGDSGIEWTSDLPPLVEDQAPPPPPTPEPTPAEGCGP